MVSELQELKAKILPVLRRNDVLRAGLFGSVVRGEAEHGSDLDILVEFAGDKSLLDHAGLELDLEAACGLPVQVVTYRALHPRLRDAVLSEQVVLL